MYVTLCLMKNCVEIGRNSRAKKIISRCSKESHIAKKFAACGTVEALRINAVLHDVVHRQCSCAFARLEKNGTRIAFV